MSMLVGEGESLRRCMQGGRERTRRTRSQRKGLTATAHPALMGQTQTTAATHRLLVRVIIPSHGSIPVILNETVIAAAFVVISLVTACTTCQTLFVTRWLRQIVLRARHMRPHWASNMAAMTEMPLVLPSNLMTLTVSLALATSQRSWLVWLAPSRAGVPLSLASRLDGLVGSVGDVAGSVGG